jgi:hypothetical protein
MERKIMSELISQLLLALLFATIGFIGGILTMVAWNHRKSNPAAHPIKEIDPDLEERVQVYTSRKDQKLIVKIDQAQINSENELDADTRENLIGLFDQLRKWLMVPEPKVSQPTITPEEQAHPVTSPNSTELTPLQMISLPLNPKKIEPLPERPLPKTQSIVSQINDVLQEMLKNTVYEPQGVRLTENPYHGVVAWIGTEHYDGIEAIPDVELKELIRKAVRRWEQQSENK